MTAQMSRLTIGKLVRYLLILVALLLVIGLVLTNYLAAAAFVLGALVYGAIAIVVNRLKGSARWQMVLLIGIVLSSLLLVCLVLGGAALLFLRYGASAMPRTLKEYTAVIQPSGSSPQVFKVDEKLVVHQPTDPQDTTIILPQYTITSTSVGFLLREVSITTTRPDSTGYATIQLPDGTAMQVSTVERPDTSLVELKNWPKGSFYAARNPESTPKITDDYDTQRIDWAMHDLSEGVSFRYVPPPYQLLRPLLAPFIGASSLSEWMLALVGFLGSVVVGPIVPSVLYDIGKSRLRARIEEMLAKPAPKAGEPHDKEPPSPSQVDG